METIGSWEVAGSGRLRTCHQHETQCVRVRSADTRLKTQAPQLAAAVCSWRPERQRRLGGAPLYAVSMSVKAWLEGHQFDLDSLVQLLPTGDTRVMSDGDGYYLTATEIDNRPAGVPFYEVAPRILQRVNGLARVKNAGYRPVRLSGRYQEGERRHQVVQVGTAACRAQVMPVTVLINGRPGPSPPPPGPAYAALAGCDSDVADVLGIMGHPEPPNWVELYKIYEIVEHTGRLKAAMDAAGISSRRISLFSRTACHPDAGGPDARHGRSRQDPPKNPMPIAKAREMIGDLVRAWMDSP